MLRCGKGYLDIVRWLCESGGATSEIDGAPGVDVRSKGGWTPLSEYSSVLGFPPSHEHALLHSVNASSKGHLPVVLYLLTKQQADPLVRNNWGETAYDVAAAVFEIWVCEVRVRTDFARIFGLNAALHRSSNGLNQRSGATRAFPSILWGYTPLFL